MTKRGRLHRHRPSATQGEVSTPMFSWEWSSCLSRTHAIEASPSPLSSRFIGFPSERRIGASPFSLKSGRRDGPENTVSFLVFEPILSADPNDYPWQKSTPA
jgi:hypothetical protein